jgi:arylsulfatase A
MPASCRMLLIFLALLVGAVQSAAGQTSAGQTSAGQAVAGQARPPNVIFILCDNLGYGDIGCFGTPRQRTPHIDRLAAEGRRLTHFYSTSGVCTPSRASLMTGCYPRRVNLHVSDSGGAVLQPVSPKGLHPEEWTLAEMLQARGYATALLGKWHLGDQPDFLPTRQGFNRYLGIPYSDDMTPREGRPWPPLPLLRDERVLEAPVDRTLLTKRYTEEAIRFVKEHRDRPFFLLLSHAMPGSTQHPFASPEFQGRSNNGKWGDSVEEIDWSTGAIIQVLQECGLDEQTLVVWSSDNGAPRRDPPQGTNRPLAGWGYTTDEGGMRVPLIARWKGRISAGSEMRELATMMDWLPTLAALAGPPLSEVSEVSELSERPIDGHDIRPLLTGSPGQVQSPYDAFYYYHMDQLQAVRSGPWKLYLPLENKRGRAGGDRSQAAKLVHLLEDVDERRDLAEAEPDIVARLLQFAADARRELGDEDQPGQGQRPAGMLSRAVPLVIAADR